MMTCFPVLTQRAKQAGQRGKVNWEVRESTQLESASDRIYSQMQLRSIPESEKREMR